MPRKGRGAKDERDYKQEPKMYNGGKIEDEPWNSWASSDYPHSGGAYASFGSLADSQTYITPKAYVPTKPHAYRTPNGGGYGNGSYRSYGTDLQDVAGVGPGTEQVFRRAGINDVEPLMKMCQQASTPENFRRKLRALDPEFPFKHNQIRQDLCHRLGRDTLYQASPDNYGEVVDDAVDILDRGLKRLNV